MAPSQSSPFEWEADAAAGHTSDGEVIQGRSHTYPEMAAAGLWTTPADLLKWAMEIAAIRDGRSDFLSRALIEEMLTPQVERMGLGVIVRGAGRASISLTVVRTSGTVRASCTIRSTGQGAAVLTNGNHGAEPGASDFRGSRECVWLASGDR